VVEKTQLCFHCPYEKRYEPEYGYLRPIIRSTVWKYRGCGIMEHGFARARCHSCGDDFFVAFSCKTRFFCPSCTQKRTLIWGDWVLDRLNRDRFSGSIPDSLFIVARWCQKEDREALGRLAQYVVHASFSQEKIRYVEKTSSVMVRSKMHHVSPSGLPSYP